MADPILRVRASGYGGSGYLIPTRTEAGLPRTDKEDKPFKVPGVTTVLGALEKPGVVQWSVNQTAAYAVANAQQLLERDEEWGYRNLQFYHQRKPDYDNPETDIHNYYSGVLDDLANTGTIIHEAIEAYVNDDVFGAPTFTRQGQVEAFEQFLGWVEATGVEFELCETTVVNVDEKYAGTLDLVVKLSGKRYLVDTKTSKYPHCKKTGRVLIHDTHISQVAALAKAKIGMTQLSKEDSDSPVYKDRHWGEFEMPKYDGYAVLQVRPPWIDDYGNEVPAFSEFHEIDKRLMEPAYNQFLGARLAREGQFGMKQVNKQIDTEYKEVDPWG